MWTPIIGHAAQIEQLQRVLASQQLAQAYLFSGPQGVGKALVARTLATLAVIPAELSRRDNGQRESRSDTTRNDTAGVTKERAFHPDVIWLRVLPDKSEISMEQWRAVEAKVQFQALEGDRKFIIIDDAELMSGSVANACLKTLEEPPANTHFILVSHDAGRLLPTIRSRCQQVVFAPLSIEVVSQWIKTQGIDPVTAQRAALLSQGSFQRAQKLAKAEVLAKLDALLANLRVGLTPRQVLTHATALATTEELPEILDGVAVALCSELVSHLGVHQLRRIRAVEQASQLVSMKGANKELILNEMLISLSVSL